MPVQDSSQAGEIEQPLDEAVDVPEQTSDDGSAEEEQQPEQTFTRAEVEAMLADFEKKVDSRIQSQVAKSENRTNQRIQERLAALDENRAVLKLSDAEYEAAQDAIIADEQKKAFKPQRPSGDESQISAPDLVEQERFVVTQLNAVFDAAGVQVTPEDPEYALIDAAWSDPKGSFAKTLMAAGKAAEQKAARVSSFKETAKSRVTGGGRTPGKASAFDPNKPASYYLEQAAKESKK